MREAGRIEIHANAVLLRPRDPVFEMRRRDLIAVLFPAAELAIEGVEIEAMFARDKRKGLFQISAQFIRRARLARIISRGDESAAQRPAEIFKAADVVALPAVERDWNF